MKKARAFCLGLVLFCSACAAPSLRFKTEVNKLVSAGQFKQAEEQILSKQNKYYKKKDATLFYLDRASLLHDAGQPAESDALFASAQEYIDDLYAKSITGSLGRFVINDLTAPYYAANYEHALTYYYRAVNFLEQGNLSAAAIEMRRAVFFLDELRGTKRAGYNDDPFVQYFASLIFESVGQRSDARICRQNAQNAYARLGDKLKIVMPEFSVPADANSFGEVIFLHYNGLLPLKKTQTIQVAWDNALAMASSPAETSEQVAPEVQNALMAGLYGSAVTLSFPELENQPYRVAASWVLAGGQVYTTQKAADFAALAKLDLEEKMPGILFRTATRAVVKEVAAVQARQAAASAADNSAAGDLAGMFVSALGAALEKADTRQWFTLPAEVRMTRIFVLPGNQNIRVLFRDGNGNIIGEHTFENVNVPRGGRVFLHYRTAY